MSSIASVCVYCGSSTGRAESMRQGAAEFGRILARNGIELVYGGGKVGLMGIIADAALDAGGRVTGVIPRFLDELERASTDLTELVRVDSMHERKTAMFERSDGFVALPGGLGTLDEIIEVITWRQLDLHDKPIVFASLDGYWAPLQSLVDSIVERGFARASHRDLYQVVESVDAVLPALIEARARELPSRPERL